KNKIQKIPIILFAAWLGGFIFFILSYGLDYHISNPKYNILTLRYLMALPGGIISAIALYLNAKLIEKRKLNKIAGRYKSLAWVFLIYGFLDGLIVTKLDFFPANVINNK